MISVPSNVVNTVHRYRARKMMIRLIQSTIRLDSKNAKRNELGKYWNDNSRKKLKLWMNPEKAPWKVATAIIDVNHFPSSSLLTNTSPLYIKIISS